MNTVKQFNWPARKAICESQLQLSQAHPTGSLVDGMPIESYWEKQLEIAHVQSATNEDILKELVAEQNKHTGIVAAHLIATRYGDGRYKRFSDWLTTKSMDI